MPPKDDRLAPLWLVTHVGLHRTAKVQGSYQFVERRDSGCLGEHY